MAVILKPTKPVTDEELLELARINPGYQVERDVRGELIVTPTGGDSARREARLIGQLSAWTERDGRGLAFSSTALFFLPDGSRLMPDASWLHGERWRALSSEERRGFVPACPDVVFEIRSAGQSSGDLRQKMHAFLANGTTLAVLIDPEARTVEIYRPAREPQLLTQPKTVALDPELPGFTLDLDAIFGA